MDTKSPLVALAVNLMSVRKELAEVHKDAVTKDAVDRCELMTVMEVNEIIIDHLAKNQPSLKTRWQRSKTQGLLTNSQYSIYDFVLAAYFSNRSDVSAVVDMFLEIVENKAKTAKSEPRAFAEDLHNVMAIFKALGRDGYLTMDQVAHKFGDGLAPWVQRDLANRIYIFQASRERGQVVTHWNDFKFGAKKAPKRFNELVTLAQEVYRNGVNNSNPSPAGQSLFATAEIAAWLSAATEMDGESPYREDERSDAEIVNAANERNSDYRKTVPNRTRMLGESTTRPRTGATNLNNGFPTRRASLFPLQDAPRGGFGDFERRTPRTPPTPAEMEALRQKQYTVAVDREGNPFVCYKCGEKGHKAQGCAKIPVDDAQKAHCNRIWNAKVMDDLMNAQVMRDVLEQGVPEDVENNFPDEVVCMLKQAEEHFFRLTEA